MAYRASPEGVLAVVEAPDAASCRAAARLYLVAVGIEKPGNLGAMARSADAAGADALVVADAEADPWNPNAIRASTGAVFTLPVVEATLAEVRGARRAARRRGRRRADAVHRRRPRAVPTAIVVGAEDTGPRRGVARSRRRRGLDPDGRAARPTASTPRPPPRSSSSRRCASVVDRDDVLRARETIGDRLARTPMLSLAHARRAPQVRALPAHRLVQAARRAHQAELADRPRRSERGVIAISAGNHAQARRVRRRARRASTRSSSCGRARPS